MENKPSSVRALHASLGVGLLVMHMHALLCIPELLDAGCYLRLVLRGCSALEQQQLPILPGIFSYLGWCKLIIIIYVYISAVVHIMLLYASLSMCKFCFQHHVTAATSWDLYDHPFHLVIAE